MRTYVYRGENVDVIAPAGGFEAGQGYLIGAMWGISTNNTAAGDRGVLVVEGVVDIPKTAGQAAALGVALYWDDTGKTATTTVGSNKVLGYCVEAALAGDATVRVKLVPNV